MESKIFEAHKSDLFGVELFFNDLKIYQDLIENFLNKEFQKHQQKWDAKAVEEKAKKEANGFENDYFLHVYKGFNEQLIAFKNEYPQNFRSSFFIQLCSILEDELRSISLMLESDSEIRFSINDLKGGSDLEKVKRYLKKGFDIDVTEIKEWDHLTKAWNVRNILIHHQGILKKDHPKTNGIRSFIKGQDGYDLIEDRRNPTHYKLILNSEAANEKLIENLDMFFCVLLPKVEAKLKHLTKHKLHALSPQPQLNSRKKY